MASVQKLSVSLDARLVRWLRARAARRRTSLSAVLSEAVVSARQFEARERVLDYLGDRADVSPSEAAKIRREWKRG